MRNCSVAGPPLHAVCVVLAVVALGCGQKPGVHSPAPETAGASAAEGGAGDEPTDKPATSGPTEEAATASEGGHAEESPVDSGGPPGGGSRGPSGDEEAEVAEEPQREESSQAEEEARATLGLPEHGEYRYETTGREEVNMPGGGRDYPKFTSITVQRDGCGFKERWDVSAQRWDERGHCVEGERRELVTITSHREFYGQSERVAFHCETDSLPEYPWAPGMGWTVTCGDDETTATSTVEVIREETLDVGGEAIDTVMLASETQIDGETSGSAAAQQWIVPESGLLVRERSETDVESRGPMGRTVAYSETYTLMLTSSQPAR